MKLAVVLALLAIVMLGDSTAAQAPGQRARVRFAPDTPWLTGHVVTADTQRVVLQDGLSQQVFPLDTLVAFQVFRSINPTLPVLAMTAVGGLTWGLLWNEDCRTTGTISFQTRTCEISGITNSRAGDAAIGAGVGLVLGLVIWAVVPGHWQTVELPLRPGPSPVVATAEPGTGYLTACRDGVLRYPLAAIHDSPGTDILRGRLTVVGTTEEPCRGPDVLVHASRALGSATWYQIEVRSSGLTGWVPADAIMFTR